MNQPGPFYELLADPFHDRVCNEVPLPPNKAMEDEVLFSDDGTKVNWRMIKDFLHDEGVLTKFQVIKICKLATDFFKKEPNLSRIAEPVCLVGDTHG